MKPTAADSMMVSDPEFGRLALFQPVNKTKRPMIAASSGRLNGIIERDVRTPMAHHIFTRLPDRSIVYIALDVVRPTSL